MLMAFFRYGYEQCLSSSVNAKACENGDRARSACSYVRPGFYAAMSSKADTQDSMKPTHVAPAMKSRCVLLKNMFNPEELVPCLRAAHIADIGLAGRPKKTGTKNSRPTSRKNARASTVPSMPSRLRSNLRLV